jgi:hypothetical protein
MKRYTKRIQSAKGLTIIEVLIASAVFMIGFSIMVFLLGDLIGKQSPKDLISASQIAKEEMELTLVSAEINDHNELKEIAGVEYRVEQIVDSEENLYKIRVNIYRAKTAKLLVSIYNEKYVR